MFLRLRFPYVVALLLLCKSPVLNAQVISDAEDAELPTGNKQTTTDVAVQLRQLYAPNMSSATAGIQEQVQLLYTLVNFRPVWTTEAGPTENAQAALTLLSQAQRYGLKPADYETVYLRNLLDSLHTTPMQLQQRLAVETHLSAALIRFSQHLSHGRIPGSTIRPAQVTESEIINAAIHVSQALQSNDLEQHILLAQPTSRSYVRLLWAWQSLLKSDTVAARKMSLPVALNLERLRWEPRADSIYLVVNIPAYSLQVVRGPQVVRSHRVVVGKAATPTPELYSTVNFLQTAPEWRMPHSIATKEILPRLKRDPRYLSSRNFRLYNQAGERVNAARVNWKTVTPAEFPYQIRQAPSSRNALGNVVFRFPNPYEVYLHDTPNRELFEASTRALSHGCIRVQHAWALARFLVQRDAGKAENNSNRMEKMSDSLNEGETRSFGLYASVPLIIRYQTCDADGSKLRQLPDIYGLDEVLTEAWDRAASEDGVTAAIH
ncbi:ErfK/YbiS/YcfS/YnhG family protein [Hymenobacter roseosalivarius DSM 11622]|uniref:ErfK/YbiS/YcfS/YnhG family protein n=1 Tax=Hymenobacter roseosalivarius DSM 11622 TaxID=645990 RepID=A0A1W1VRX8_9BACT|nr:L,D-transpeptidase family protein [Hymenobacter roseosalivarius]SMB96096.1 ErfK/YbiS/YcfS/YnhG family protein [Hymenobacter roseosalivarius DSM 11622]